MDNMIELATFNDNEFGMITQFVNDRFDIVFLRKNDDTFIPITEDENAALINKYLGDD